MMNILDSIVSQACTQPAVVERITRQFMESLQQQFPSMMENFGKEHSEEASTSWNTQLIDVDGDPLSSDVAVLHNCATNSLFDTRSRAEGAIATCTTAHTTHQQSSPFSIPTQSQSMQILQNTTYPAMTVQSSQGSQSRHVQGRSTSSVSAYLQGSATNTFTNYSDLQSPSSIMGGSDPMQQASVSELNSVNAYQHEGNMHLLNEEPTWHSFDELTEPATFNSISQSSFSDNINGSARTAYTSMPTFDLSGCSWRQPTSQISWSHQYDQVDNLQDPVVSESAVEQGNNGADKFAEQEN